MDRAGLDTAFFVLFFGKPDAEVVLGTSGIAPSCHVKGVNGRNL